MTNKTFTEQMQRIADTFGNQMYSKDRLALIWKEVQEFEDNWFVRVCDQLIGECRIPPLLPEFRENISKERERLYLLEKRNNRKEAEDFMTSFTEQEIRDKFGPILKLLK